jgi:hypothetical protein
MAVTVACVYWGNKFSLDYVYNLKAMVERNTTVDYNFICLTDRNIPGVDCRILRPGYEGWWNKMQIFDEGQDLGERVIYIDLDTIITNNIDWLLEDRSWFMGIEDVGAVNPHQPHLKGVLQTGVMSFDTAVNAFIWPTFVMSFESATQKYRGDGEYLSDIVNPYARVLLQNKYKGQLKSYKYDVYPGPPKKDTSIVCFHGRPSIEQAITTTVKTTLETYSPQEWIKDYWRV